MDKLLINKDSWHYSYWLWLRTFWGANDLPNQTSLCPYCQTMFWLSVWTFLISPFLAMGWVFKKVTRYSYVQLVEGGVDGMVNFIDSFWIFRLMDKITSAGEEVIAWNCLANAFAFFTICLAISVVTGMLVSGVLFLPLAIWYIIWGIGIGLLYVGWGVIWILGAVGALLSLAGQGIFWLFHAGWLWERTFTVVGWGFLCLAGAAIITFSVVHILTSPLAMRFWRWTSFKFNGYVEARTKAEWHRKERRWRIEKGELPAPKPNRFAEMWRGFWRMVCTGIDDAAEKIHDFFTSRKVEWKGNSAKVLSPMAAMWTFLVALKKGVCPLVEFVDGDQLPVEEMIPGPIEPEVVETTQVVNTSTIEERWQAPSEDEYPPVRSVAEEPTPGPVKEDWEKEPQNMDVQNIIKEEPKSSGEINDPPKP